MSNPEWGVKRVCPETGKRFYDLNRDPVISPYTGKEVAIDSSDRRESMVEAMNEKAKKARSSDDEDLLVDEDDSVDIDDDLLEDEDDDTVALDDIADVSSDEDD